MPGFVLLCEYIWVKGPVIAPEKRIIGDLEVFSFIWFHACCLFRELKFPISLPRNRSSQVIPDNTPTMDPVHPTTRPHKSGVRPAPFSPHVIALFLLRHTFLPSLRLSQSLNNNINLPYFLEFEDHTSFLNIRLL